MVRLVSSLLITAFAIAGPALAGDNMTTRWDAFIEATMEDAGTAPGLSICVVRADGPVYVKGFGLRNVEEELSVTANTGFYIASSTKPFTGMAAAVLAEQGVLDLDAPVTRYLPDLALPAPMDPREVTLLEMLTHRTGVMNVPVQRTLAFERELNLEEFYERMLSESEPVPETFIYSNLGYNMMGYVFEAVTGESWKQVVTEMVLRPVGMRATTTSVEAAVATGDFALPYVRRDDGFERRDLKTDGMMHAAGGIVTTANDMARWLVANINNGVINGSAVIDPEVVRAAHEKYTDTDRRFYEFHRRGYGLGWYHADFDGELLMHHFGGYSGYHAHMSFMPEHDVGIAVLINANDYDAGTMTHMIAAYIYETLLGRGGVEARYAKKRDEYAAETAAELRLEAGVQAALGTLASGEIDKGMDMVMAAFEEGRRAGVIEEGEVNNLGYALLKRDLVEEAIRVFEFNVELNPDSPNVYDSLGEAYEKAGRLEEARDSYRKAVELTEGTEHRLTDAFRENLERVSAQLN